MTILQGNSCSIAQKSGEIYTAQLNLQPIPFKSDRLLGECFRHFIPHQHLRPSESGALSRRCFFSKENTFWAFFTQALGDDGGCQEVIRKLQAFAAMKSKPLPSSSTAAHCQARSKLDLPVLETILQHTANRLLNTPDSERMNGRRVVVVDGTGVSMPDTIASQLVWPQQRHQKAGCGFPQAAICACFCLHTGALLSHKVGNKKSHELPILREQWDTFKSGDIFLGDKGFCSYFDLSSFKDRGVDSVITLARRIPVTKVGAVEVLGNDDLLIHWKMEKAGQKQGVELFQNRLGSAARNPSFAANKSKR